MHKHKRSARKHNMRGGAFETIKDITGNPMELFNIKPGDYYKFFNFHMRFYDFNIEEHKQYKEAFYNYGIESACIHGIKPEYYSEVVEKTRFAIIISFYQFHPAETSIFRGKTIHYKERTEEYLDSFIYANDFYEHNKGSKKSKSKSKSKSSNSTKKSKSGTRSTTGSQTKKATTGSQTKGGTGSRGSDLKTDDLYVSLTCSRKIYSPAKYEETKPPGTKEEYSKYGDVNTGFGIILRCILLNYAKTIGFKNVYNDASFEGLVRYYTRFGFRLGKQKCGEPDEITAEHEEIIKNKDKATLEKNEKDFVKKITDEGYTTKNGYRMKLCGINYDEMCSYSYKKIKETWAELEKYTDIYTSN
jgi:hypothetical protein